MNIGEHVADPGEVVRTLRAEGRTWDAAYIERRQRDYDSFLLDVMGWCGGNKRKLDAMRAACREVQQNWPASSLQDTEREDD